MKKQEQIQAIRNEIFVALEKAKAISGDMPRCISGISSEFRRWAAYERSNHNVPQFLNVAKLAQQYPAIYEEVRNEYFGWLLLSE